MSVYLFGTVLPILVYSGLDEMLEGCSQSSDDDKVLSYMSSTSSVAVYSTVTPTLTVCTMA